MKLRRLGSGIRFWRFPVWGLVLVLLSATSITFGVIPENVSAATNTLQMRISVDYSAVKVGEMLNFSANVTGSTGGLWVSWDFDNSDGIQVDKAKATTTFVYGHPGTYTVTATARDFSGSVVQEVLPIEVTERTYVKSLPIMMQNCNATAQNPIIIENLDLTASDANAIDITNCSHVIIRNNRIHDVTTSNIPRYVDAHAIATLDSSDIKIYGNVISDNFRGVWVHKTVDGSYRRPDHANLTNISVYGNWVERSSSDNGLDVWGATGVEVHGNVLKNNGDPAHFENHRIVGIEVWNSTTVKVFDNLSIESTSDGMCVAVDIRDFVAGRVPLSKNVEIYNNVSRHNGEQGIWLRFANGGSVHDNYVTENDKTVGLNPANGILFEDHVDNFKVYGNRLSDDVYSEISLINSSHNEVFSNYLSPGTKDFDGISIIDFASSVSTPIPEYSSYNKIYNNVIVGGNVAIRIRNAKRTSIINNTINATLSAGIVLDKSAILTTIYNNIITNTKGNFQAGDTNNPEGYAFIDRGSKTIESFNLFYGNRLLPPKTMSNKFDYKGNPNYVNVATQDFRLSSSSKALQVGNKRVQTCPSTYAIRTSVGAYCGDSLPPPRS